MKDLLEKQKTIINEELESKKQTLTKLSEKKAELESIKSTNEK